MRKALIMTAAGLVSSVAGHAQDKDPYVIMNYNRDIFQICSTIFVVGMFMYFIIVVMNKIFEHRLKNKIVDKGITETVAQSILQTKSAEESKTANIKWFSILAGIGIGLTGVNYTQPLGFHSLAIMAFSISLSFLGYYLFIRNISK